MKYKVIIDKNAEEEIVVIAREASDLTAQIAQLIDGYRAGDGIVGYGDDDMRRLAFDEIECITVLARRVTAIDRHARRYRLHERLRDLEAVLPAQFIRINKSTLANEHHILRFDTAFGGGVDAVFRCGYREYVSRRCFAEIRRRYDAE